MGRRMKEKYDKYWGLWHENSDVLNDKGKGKEKEKENINMLIFVAAVLDPRYKLSEYVELAVDEMYGEGIGQKVWSALNKCLHDLFQEYSAIYSPTSEATTPSSEAPQSNHGGQARMMKSKVAKRMRLNNGSSSCSRGCRTELDKYLAEECEEDTKKFDILAWWKGQTSRFPILSKLARDVLGIPISTVASESAFSTSGRILDDFRTSLTPFMVEALVCTQDWFRRGTPVSIVENTEELAKLEEALIQEFKDKAIIENNASKSQVLGSKASKASTATTKSSKAATKSQQTRSAKSQPSKTKSSVPSSNDVHAAGC
ncbi:hypothetical protein ACP70R_025833 [Stipagrostis hirtigluma subsp. patula]